MKNPGSGCAPNSALNVSKLATFVGMSRSPLRAGPMNAAVEVPTPWIGGAGANSSM